MFRDKQPLGRERAIETLIDLEPSGARYRATRISEEILPHSLKNRPNLVARSALVEQSHSLAEYEIDSSEKYRDAFNWEDSKEISLVDETTRDRVLRHHEKIVKCKNNSAENPLPSLLVTKLKGLFGPELHEKVSARISSTEEIDIECTNKASDGQYNIEAILGSAVTNGDLDGLLLAALSVLTGCIMEDDTSHEPDLSKGKTSNELRAFECTSNPDDIPVLQVGAILSLLKQDDSCRSSFSLDQSILDYLQKASAVYEERIEIQKARLLTKIKSEDGDKDDQSKSAEKAEVGSASDRPILVVPLAQAEDNSDAVLIENDPDDNGETEQEERKIDGNDAEVGEDDVNEEDEAEAEDGIESDDDDDDGDGDDENGHLATSALSAAVFDRIISAVAGEDESMDGVERAALRLATGGVLGEDSSDSESTNDHESNHLDHYSPHNDTPHAAEGNEDSSSEEHDHDIVHDDVEEVDGNEESDSILRQALALSLAEHNSDSTSSNVASENKNPEDLDKVESITTPIHVLSCTSQDSADEHLPDLPTPPSYYPYCAAGEFDEDVGEKLDPCLDPASLSRFGSVPASFVMVHLLHNTLLYVLDHGANETKVKEKNKQEFKFNPIVGGIGSSLFGSELELVSSNDSDGKDGTNGTPPSSLSLQMLVAAFLLFFESRSEAIDQLRDAILDEQRNAHGEDETYPDRDINDTPLSDDEEETALPMTLNYPERDAPAASLVSPSSQTDLENKGMTRKAAAAGFDAAMRMKSLRKKIDAWKDRVKLYSLCTFLAMKCLRCFIQARVSHGLDLRTNSLDESREPFFKVMQRVCSKVISEKLSESLSTLLNINEFRSLSTLVSGENMDEVEELFMPLQLYREALGSWGEFIPLQYSTPSDRESILRSLIKECFSRSQSFHHFGSFETLSSFPDIEESQLYKLDMLCRRLSVADLLDDLVSRPLCFNPDLSSLSAMIETKAEISTNTASSLYSLLYSSSAKARGVSLRFLGRLNMALCHRCIVRSILWDGLHASSQFDTTDEMPSFSASNPGSEAIKVCPDPSVALQFDSTKCSDSIAILSSHSDSSNGASAHQRASKVWGTVISSTFFNPKSGVHRWAIRLDRCERGHVFVGVSTAQASMRTYVGGDKYGWGLIGTQALWHDRRKIRGDFGAAFRTGSIIVVTLDSNAGTLSFGTWKEANSSASSFSLDPMILASPRKATASGGTLEDWGVAFEGLPLDAKLYPAVGLYQRDDRVTLLSVESGQSGGSNVAIAGEFFTSGMAYFPQPGNALQQDDGALASNVLNVSNHNSALSWDAIDFVDYALQRSIEGIESTDRSQQDLALNSILPSLSAALCLFPSSIPVLSARFASHLLPKITECISALDVLVDGENKLFPGVLREGKWVIRATGSFNNARSNEVEEYVVELKNKLGEDGNCLGFLGDGVGTTGKSKNGLVSISGTITGSSIKFVEDWTDGVQERMTEETSSSCFICARLSLDGYKFEGTYQNLQYGTSGRIAALCISEGKAESAGETNLALRCQSLLRIAHGNLANIIGNDTAGDHSLVSTKVKDVEQKAYLRSLLSSSLLRSGPIDSTSKAAANALDSLREMYDGDNRVCSLLRQPRLISVKPDAFVSTSLIDLVKENDLIFAGRNGGHGSLFPLCRDLYDEARVGVIAVLVHHCHLQEKLISGESTSLDKAWRAALTLLEDQVRMALSDNDGISMSMKEKSAQRCNQIVAASKFLLSIESNQDTPLMMPDTLRLVTLFYSKVKSSDDISFFYDEFESSARRACLRLIAIQASMNLFSSYTPSNIAVECTSLAFPQFLGQCFKSEVQNLSLSNEDDGFDAGRHYLSNIPGAGSVLNQCIKACVKELLLRFGCLTKSLTSTNSLVENESALLSLLPVLASSLHPDDMESLILDIRILEPISCILRQRRSTLKTKGRVPHPPKSNETSLLLVMRQMVNDDLSRMVLRVALAVLNVITYQATCWSEKMKRAADHRHSKMSSAVTRCIRLLIDEFTDSVPFLETKLKESMDSHLENEEAILYKKWLKATVPEAHEYVNKKNREGRSGQSGLKQMISRGSFTTTSVSPTTNSKSKSNTQSSVGGSSTTGSDEENALIPCDITCGQHLSRCLDILNCVIRSDEVVSTIAEQDNSLEQLFRILGISIYDDENKELCNIEVNREGSKLPATIRARLIRFLPMMLSRSQAKEEIVKAFLMLIAKASAYKAVSLNGDEALVASEAISGLRILYSSPLPGWRDVIKKVIIANAPTSESMASSNILTIGALAFIAGTPRALRPGCLVLLKPGAAAPLSPGAQSTPNSKSHGSASGSSNTAGITSHHIVGNGTEGIIAGLCRLDAGAGVVSSIDLKTGICEIILIDREFEQKHSSSWHKSSGSLTVRALRSPLAEVAQAELTPFVIPSSFPASKFLRSALMFGLNLFESFLRMESSETIEKQEINSVQVSLLAIRASIVLFSDKRVLPQILECGDYKDVFPALLRLASIDRDASHKAIETLQSESLASLPMHEGKYFHFLQMLAEMQARNDVLCSTSQNMWSKRHDDICLYKKEEAKVDEEKMPTPERADSGISETSDIHVESTSHREDGASNSSGNTIASRRIVSQSSIGTNGTDDDDESEAAATAAAHLREAAIAQMAELGLPRSWSELALRRTGGTNIEAAVHFCLERGGEMERLLAEERERERMMQRQPSGGPSRRRGNRSESSSSSHLIRQLLEMGFPSRWCTEALAATRNNVDEALTWILTNGERLSAEDEGVGDEDDDEDEDEEDEDYDEEDEEEDEEDDEDTELDGESPNNEPLPSSGDADVVSSSDLLGKKEARKETGEEIDSGDERNKAWTGSVTPIRFISGRSLINHETLSVSGLPSGGFSSVGTKGVLLTSGKWYYEAILETAGCLQIGWADGSFSGHCHAERGDGCGDGPSSWAYDGWRRYRWHATATEWGCRWKEGDVIGCLVDMDEKIVSFTLNGKGKEIGMGEAFSGHGFRPCGGVYACVSFNRKEKLRLILGGEGNEPFKYKPPDGYCGVGEAVLESVKEREMLLEKEKVLDDTSKDGKTESRFLCDFSDGEHGHELFAWQHRYYGSDASVHLGSARSSKQSSGNSKASGGNSLLVDSSPLACIVRELEKKWERNDVDFEQLEKDASLPRTEILSTFKSVLGKISGDALDEGLALGILYSKKLILHLVITFGSEFDLNHFTMDNELAAARSFWRVIDTCISLRSAGWVGEAGAMAIAAEALGLGISSTEHQSKNQLSGRSGLSCIQSGNETALIPVAGISQLLSSIVISEGDDVDEFKETWSSLAACAEASIGADGGGGLLVFLQRGLQSAACRSESLRSVLVAIIRRSVRLLAVVDYSGDDSSSSENLDEDDLDVSTPSLKRQTSTRDTDDKSKIHQPDARFTCFLTGLLLSRPVQECIDDKTKLFQDLFEAWSIGLLSASAPWRMVCALTVSGILNESPQSFTPIGSYLPVVKSYYERLQNTVLRRMWAERAAVPICSRYVQALIELIASARRTSLLTMSTSHLSVDAATPLPSCLPKESTKTDNNISWEWEDGWVESDSGWEVWVGSVECMAVDWKTPSRSAVRTLMDGGEGPPFLREGCQVLRGLDWDDSGSGSITGDEDGKKKYEAEKAEREKEKKALEQQAAEDPAEPDIETGDASNDEQSDPATIDNENTSSLPVAENEKAEASKKRKRIKIPNPKLPVGTVVSVEPWNGIHAMARRVRWNLTGEEGVYRYGGDGGRFDICHVELNEKCTRVRKRHPLPESSEQCVARHGFGSGKKHNVLLRIRRQGKNTRERDESEREYDGILEWPDFGAGVRVTCVTFSDGAVLLKEEELIFGSKDSGWEARFGQPSYISGTEIILSPTGSTKRKDMAELDTRSSFLSLYQELLGSTSYVADCLRNRSDGSKVRMTLEMRMLRALPIDCGAEVPKSLKQTARSPPPMCFDRDFHASSMSLSRDGRSLTCVSPDGRGTAFASVGFTKGVHYWEVKLEQADIGSVFIGVAEKPSGSGANSGGSFSQDSHPRLNRWLGWGFVNFRATYTSGAERVYGAHCHNEDTVGVLLDCDSGRLSFFYDGLKYGEHILNDLGCAFENISPFGFNADGCGSGGAGQGAPSGIEGGRGGRYPAHGVVRPRALWPVIGLRNPGDRVTLSTKWSTCSGIDSSVVLKNVLATDELIAGYCGAGSEACDASSSPFPDWFVKEAYDEYCRWHSGRWYRTSTRASGPHRLATFGLDIELDRSPLACATACAALGLQHALLAGDRVIVKRSAGRPLELAEEALILGAYQCRLYYRIVAQKSEGGSLTEGGGRAWFWDETEVVGDSLQVIHKTTIHDIELPLIDRFRCLSPGGIKIVYERGAVVRSDLEIFDGSVNMGSIPAESIIPRKDVLERRVNSLGLIRYRVRYEGVGEGWISSRIRGGNEEAIVEVLYDDSKPDMEPYYRSPEEAAMVWFEKLREKCPKFCETEAADALKIGDLEEFIILMKAGVLAGKSLHSSDSIVCTLVNAINDYSSEGKAVECSFSDTESAVDYAMASAKDQKVAISTGSTGVNQAAASILIAANAQFSSKRALLARMAILRAFNRRLRRSLPWLSLRPSQEGTAIMGGLCGQGASVDRAGRCRLVQSLELWVQVPSIASRIRSLRGLVFSSIKAEFLESVIHVTTTPTPLSHDEYELPREIRTVRVNRLRARRAMAGNDAGAKQKYSVFSQLQSETRNWGGAALRRGFVAKGHGGQKRAFKIKLIGEGVNDYSGPYREVFTDALHEVLEYDQDERGTLGVLDPTPNNSNEIGDERELYMFAQGEREAEMTKRIGLSSEEVRIRDSFSSLTMTRDERSREIEECLVFLGRLVGTACRHGIPVDLPLPLNLVWKSISEEQCKAADAVAEIDILASKNPSQGEGLSLLWWQQRMLNSFVDGMSHLLPVELLPILSAEELRAMLCGNPDVDVDLLKRVVEYEGFNENDDVICYFWDALREMSNADRKKFLQFVWARSRLPNKESDFDASFKIQKASGGNDSSLPSASTCFFSLALPEYTSKDILKQKLKFAFENVCTMESDYVTNDAEVGEGWRGI